MPQVFRPISGHLVGFKCDRCDKGYYERAGTPPELKYPRQWLHKCNHCGIESHFSTAYPMFRATTQRHRVRDFILLDDVPVPHSLRAVKNDPSNTFRMIK